MGRPQKKIDPDQVRRLAMINCSYAEMAAVLGCNESTLTRRFAQVINEGREQGRSSLKRMMWEACQKGNTVMMIWLSKNMLGYSDKMETTASVHTTVDVSIEERKKVISKLVQEPKTLDALETIATSLIDLQPNGSA